MFINSVDVFLEEMNYQFNTNKPKELKYVNKIKELIRNTKWMNKCTFLTVDNRIIQNCKLDDCSINFTGPKNNGYTHNMFEMFREGFYDSNIGFFVHTDCWKLVKKTYNINLTYSHLSVSSVKIKKPENWNKIFPKIKYGLIEKYWGQDFNFFKIIADNKQELCVKPNLKTIKSVISKLKIRDDNNRKSPVSSASLYPSSTYKIGNNKNI